MEAGKKKTAVFEPLIDRRSLSLLDEVAEAYKLQAAQRGMTLPARVGEPVLTALEQEAASLVVEQVAGTGAGGRGGRAGAGAPAAGAPPAGAAPPARGGAGGRGAAGPSLPTEFNAEFNGLLGRKMTVLEIRDFLSGEFSPLPLESVMAVLKAREASGAIRLVKK